MRGAMAMLLLACVAACASTGGGSARNPNVLTLAEIEAADQMTAWDLVQVERPWWLRKRGATSFSQETPVLVYMHGNRLGGPEQLEQISTIDIREMRYFGAAEAQARFGLGNVSGAIEIFTRR